MAVAKKAVVWGLFALGGTITSFLFPALILLFLFIAMDHTPINLEYGPIHQFASGLPGKACFFIVISLALWHAAHRLRVVFHDFGVRNDKVVANAVYLVAAIGTALTAFYLYLI